MNNDNVTGDAEFLEFLRGALIKVHAKDFSIKQIQEAYVIAELTTAIFQDSLERIYRKRYGNVAEVPTPQPCQNCKLLQEKFDALWLIHVIYEEGAAKQCEEVIAWGSGFYEPESHEDNPKLQKALKTLFPKK